MFITIIIFGGHMPKNLIEELEELRLLLDGAQTERYKWFIDNGQYGRDCGYAIKAKELFESLYSDEIQKKIEDICKAYYGKTLL